MLAPPISVTAATSTPVSADCGPDVLDRTRLAGDRNSAPPLNSIPRFSPDQQNSSQGQNDQYRRNRVPPVTLSDDVVGHLTAVELATEVTEFGHQTSTLSLVRDDVWRAWTGDAQAPRIQTGQRVTAGEPRAAREHADHRTGEDERHHHVDERGQTQHERETTNCADRQVVQNDRGQNDTKSAARIVLRARAQPASHAARRLRPSRISSRMRSK